MTKQLPDITTEKRSISEIDDFWNESLELLKHKSFEEWNYSVINIVIRKMLSEIEIDPNIYTTDNKGKRVYKQPIYVNCIANNIYTKLLKRKSKSNKFEQKHPYFGLVFYLDSFYFFNGVIWSKCNERKMNDFISEVGLRMDLPSPAAEDEKTLKNVTFQLKQALTIEDMDLGLKSFCFVFRNGTLRLNGEPFSLNSWDKKDFNRNILPFEYDPNVECPTFKKFLNDIFTTEQQDVIQQFLGSIFFSKDEFKAEKMLWLIGSGSNGKSTFLDVIEYVLGGESNVTAEPLDMIFTRSKDGTAYNTANKLLNISREVSDSIKIPTDLFKTYVTKEPYTCAIKNRPSVTITKYASLIASSNEILNIKSSPEAVWRRIIPIKLTKSFKGVDKDPLLYKKLIKECQGIFNWILDGYKIISERKKIVIPESISSLIDNYKDLTTLKDDIIDKFIEDFQIRYAPEEKADASKIWQEFDSFQRDFEKRKNLLTKTEFGRKFSAKIIEDSADNNGGIRIVRDDLKYKNSRGNTTYRISYKNPYPQALQPSF